MELSQIISCPLIPFGLAAAFLHLTSSKTELYMSKGAAAKPALAWEIGDGAVVGI
jgi:hypothetical protein